MKKTSIYLTTLFACIGLYAMAQNKIIVHTDGVSTKISKEIYGHFAEHLGRCIYGGIYVGDTSAIPNIRGFRTDVVGALQDIQIPVLRWPGGCFADTYHWMDGIGPQSERASIVNVHWGGVTEDNSFGTHEFLDFCELIKTEPFISLNVGSGTVREASEWVEYVTSSNKSPMTDLRKKNGRTEPWKVKFWGVGNETWGCGGEMTAEYYSDIYRQYAGFIRGANYKVACFASDSQYEWTEVLMKNTQNKQHLIQGLSLHYYTITHDWSYKGSATKFTEQEWFTTLSKTLFMDEIITKHSIIMDKYDPAKKVGLVVDEWGNWFEVEPGTNGGFLYQQNTLRDALVAGINLNIFNNHSDRVQMANIAQAINVLQSVILTKDDKMVLTPTYYVFKMYAVHQDATLIPLNLKSENYELDGKSIPAVNASASIKEGVVSITLCNLNPNKSAVTEFTLMGQDFTSANGQVITGSNMADYNDFDKAEKVNIKPFTVQKPKNGNLKIELPAKSVVLIQLK
jgi:alpha-N-arabinofuranosidase